MTTNIKLINYLFLFIIGTSCSSTWADNITKNFELLAPPHITDPYVLDIPFRVNEVGVVNAYVTFNNTNNKKVKEFGAMLWQDVKKGKRAQAKVKKLSTSQISYAVDSLNLKQTKSFFIRLVNHNPAGIVRGTVTVEYPGKTHNMPDLVVTKAHVDSACRVSFTLKNNGKGTIPMTAWDKKSPVNLAIERFNKPWGAAALRAIDPTKRLIHPGGFALYRTQLVAPSKHSENIAVVLDSKNRVREINEQNNRQNFTIKCAKPDLVVSKLYLNNECKVVAEIKNQGEGKLLPTHYQNDGVMVSILRNGKSWGGSAIKIIDPQQRLLKPGGTAIYRSRLKIANQDTKIQVRVDQTNKAEESNENNNFRNKELKCEPNKPLKMAPLKPMNLKIQQ